MQHLNLYIRCKRQALSLHRQCGLDAALMFKFLQRGGQRRLDVFGIGTGSEVQKEFADIAITFFHASVNFFQNFGYLCGILGLQGIAHQLHLDFQERQRLRN